MLGTNEPRPKHPHHQPPQKGAQEPQKPHEGNKAGGLFPEKAPRAKPRLFLERRLATGFNRAVRRLNHINDLRHCRHAIGIHH